MIAADPPTGAPALGRRLAALAYEGVLLFGVSMVAGWLYAVVTQQRHALSGRTGLQLFLFVVLAVYFVWFWTHGGQTLAMKAWRVRLIAADRQPLTPQRAFARYLLCWLWFLPSLGAIRLSGLEGSVPIGATVLSGALAYALSSRLHPQRQFLHDALAGTRLVDAPRHGPSARG